MKTLTGAEWQGGLPMLRGRALACGFYLNELLLKLLAREDPHPGLFDTYREALDGLAGPADQAACLRRFELRLLREVGYGLSLTHEAESAQPLDPDSRYHYVFERGPVPYSAHGDVARYPEVSGQTLLAMAARIRRCGGQGGSQGAASGIDQPDARPAGIAQPPVAARPASLRRALCISPPAKAKP